MVTLEVNKQRKLRRAILIGGDVENGKQDANTSENSAVYSAAVTLYACTKMRQDISVYARSILLVL
jgi:hypothetical protein